jgi:thiamine kinase
MDKNLSQPIAYGRTAEIYAWHQGQIVKLFYDWFGLENIEIEARNTRAAHASGLPVPAVGEIICVNDRYGLEYQRVYGISMFKMVKRKPWNIIRYGWRMAELQAALHASTVPLDLPSQRQILENNIRHAEALPTPLRAKVLAALETMPDSNQLCHGDFWPDNILMTAQGEIIIDWFRASRGNPLADLARTTNLILGYTRTRQIQRPFLTFGSTKINQIKNSLFQVFCRICYPAFLDYYFKLRPGGQEEYHRWLPIVAAARLSDNIPELEEMLIAQVEKSL